jgi:hypothetical protein
VGVALESDAAREWPIRRADISGCESAAGDSVVPRVPSRVLTAVRVVEHPLIKRVADLAFEGAQRAFAGHPFGAFALIVGSLRCRGG